MAQAAEPIANSHSDLQSQVSEQLANSHGDSQSQISVQMANSRRESQSQLSEHSRDLQSQVSFQLADSRSESQSQLSEHSRDLQSQVSVELANGRRKWQSQVSLQLADSRRTSQSQLSEHSRDLESQVSVQLANSRRTSQSQLSEQGRDLQSQVSVQLANIRRTSQSQLSENGRDLQSQGSVQLANSTSRRDLQSQASEQRSNSQSSLQSKPINVSNQSIEKTQVPVPIAKLDFHPKKIEAGSKSRYETLVELIQKANYWLNANPSVKVFKVETVTYPVTDFEHFADQNSSGKRNQFDNQIFIRYLRVWVRSPTPEDFENGVQDEPQILYSVNITPRKLRRNNTYEGMESAVQRFFTKLKKEPLEGRIVSAVTEEITVDDWPNEVQPDQLSWKESKHGETAYVTIMRLFILWTSEANVEDIGFTDFVPKVLGYNESMNVPEFESIPTVLDRARDWINQHTNVDIADIQTIRCRTRDMIVEERTPVNNSKTLVYGTSDVELFVYYVRVYYHEVYVLPEDGVFEDDDVTAVDLYHRTFLPHIYRGTKTMPINVFTDQSFTIATMSAWLRASHAKILTVETCPIVHTSAGLLTDSDVTWYRSSQMGNVIVYITRLYIDGSFVEPMPSALPNPPLHPKTVPSDEKAAKRKSCVVQ